MKAEILKPMRMGCTVGKNRHGNLYLRVYVNNREFREGTAGMRDTPRNRRLLEAQATLIAEEIERGVFSYLKWFPKGNAAGLFRAEEAGPQAIRQYHETWKKDKVAPFIKKTRARKYESHFRAHILPFHGDRYMHLYSFSDIRELRTHLVEVEKLAMKTAKNIVNATLRAFFRDAVAEGVVERTPFDDVPKKWWPRSIFPDPDPFTEDERDRILGYFQRKYASKWFAGYAFVCALFWTGARPSELAARRWRDYNPRTGKLSITTSRAEGEEGAPKTTKSRRTIELFPNVRKILEALEPLRATPMDFIFTNRRGKPIDQKEFAWRHFWPALTVLGIGKKDFYSTRDTFISVMLSHGERSKEIADYTATSLVVIESSYGKMIRKKQGFGQAALEAAKQPGGKEKTG